MNNGNTPELKTHAAKLQPAKLPLTRLERKLQATLRRFNVGAQSGLVVGVSGGADSMALLDALLRLWRRKGWPAMLHAAHVNHLLRGAAAEADLQFVQAWAAQHEVGFTCLRVDVAKHAQNQGRNWEATARAVRYDFFQAVAREHGAQFGCTAHTFDDQVETLLLRLLRGTGAGGLRGIHEMIVGNEGVCLLRPLLNVTRVEVLAHCAQYDVEFRTDETNASEAFTRNRVRHSLLPLLHSFNPRFGETLARTAVALAEDDACLQQRAAELLRQASEGPRLRHAPLRTSHPALTKRVLRAWLQRESGATVRADAVHLEALVRLIVHGQGGGVIELPGSWRVVREAGWLCLRLDASETEAQLAEKLTETRAEAEKR